MQHFVSQIRTTLSPFVSQLLHQTPIPTLYLEVHSVTEP